jgi:hypothetical protein
MIGTFALGKAVAEVAGPLFAHLAPIIKTKAQTMIGPTDISVVHVRDPQVKDANSGSGSSYSSGRGNVLISSTLRSDF